jgi:uncharacterized RDD family membrane protein YckC
MGEEEAPPEAAYPGQEAPSRFYLAREGQRHGPFSLEEAKEQLKRAFFTAEDLAWYPGAPGWKRVAEIPWLAEAAVTETPPEPPKTRPAGPPPGVVVAKLVPRLAAGILDLLLVSMAARFTEPDLDGGAGVSDFLFFFYLVSLVILYWAYHTLAESSPYQATLGKWLAGLKVVNEKGDRLSPGQAGLRSLLKIFSLVPLGLGLLPILFSQHRRGLADIFAKTYVAKLEKKS